MSTFDAQNLAQLQGFIDRNKWLMPSRRASCNATGPVFERYTDSASATQLVGGFLEGAVYGFLDLSRSTFSLRKEFHQ